ncbi:MAG: GT4 family glycosyltransferase PelF [Eubacterium sp.]|nr:GT4 family glycosyltransferase PelF [Eubacterium sp.]
MKICIVAEGCYPYVVGGVSSWIHNIITSFPEHRFIILAIVSDRSKRGQFVYDLPDNVEQVQELYLNDVDWAYPNKSEKVERSDRASHQRLSKKECEALLSLILDNDPQWDVLFKLFNKPTLSIDKLLMGKDFLYAVKESYRQNHSDVVFSNYLWTMRSIYLPLFITLKFRVPDADLYHCVATGYAGILGSKARFLHGCKLLISEHGIYTREREEEMVKAKWVQGIYKNIWIDQFKKMSFLAYERADLITSLYEHARELQIELGAPVSKLKITPNGIREANFADIPGKTKEDKDYCNIGAVLRVAPIKDVKTLIRAFYYAKQREKSLRLYIMGSYDEEPEYAQECFDMVDSLGVKDVFFTGRVNVREYLGRMDCTILTSISEGQPLTILEGFAAHKPCIATDVGNCRGLIFGEGDDFGQAGILTHIMNIEELSNAMVEMAQNEVKRERMGNAGYNRLMSKYKNDQMIKTYREIYDGFELGGPIEEELA